MRYNQTYDQPRGGMSFGPGGLSPWIKWMLIANGGMFVAQLLYPTITGYLGLAPGRFFSDFPNWLYTPFTYMFLHGGFLHLAFNMFALWMFGTEIEFTWGTKPFRLFYLLAGLSGGLLTLIVNPGDATITVGASAAIYGVLVAYWFMFPNRMLYIYFLIPVKVKYAIPGMMILVFLTGGATIAHMAHLGGALFAVLYMKFDWQWLRFGRTIKNLRYRRKEAKLQKNRERAEDIMKRVDAILDRINEVGIDNLTPAERKFLEEASSKLSSKSGEDS